MASEGRAVNPREEEKELDDKLMELGLLEPGMTLQEKREMASVVLESTRMAEEHRNQRNAEEHWESLVLEPKTTESSPRSESPEFIAISVSKTEPRRQTPKSAVNQNRRDSQASTVREIVGKGRGRMEKDVRERRGKREREDDIPVKGETIVVEVEGEEEDERRVEARKNEGGRMLEFTRRKKDQDHSRRECELERPQKLLGVEEAKSSKAKEVEETIGPREIKEKGRERVEEMGGRKEVSIPQNVDQKGSPKVVSASDGKASIAGSFYGPSCSSNAKELNPLRSELHGYSRKRGPSRGPQVSLLQLAKEEVPQRKKSLDEAEIEELVLDDETSHEKRSCDESVTRGSKESKPTAEARDAEDRRLFLERHMGGNRKVVQEKAEVRKLGVAVSDGDDWETDKGGMIWRKETRKRNGAGVGSSGLKEGCLPSFRGNSERTLSLLAGAGKMKRKEQDMEEETEEGSEVDEDENGGGEPHSNGRSPLSDFIVEGKKKRRLTKWPSSKKWVDVVIFPNSSCATASDGNIKDTPKTSKKILLPPNKRWRRVKRVAQSSFGSGSEVDEWISSEEEQKSPGESLSKEQLVARFDEQINRLKVALKENCEKNGSSRSHFSRCKLCEKKSTVKVPPGFQEPDSDDECNLWKICFSNPTSDLADNKSQLNSSKKKVNSDAIPLTYRSAVTRSQTKQVRVSRTHRSESKSPTSFEGDLLSTLPEAEESTSAMEIVQSDDDALQNKSPLSGEVVLIDKVIPSQSSVTTGTQTPWEDDRTVGVLNSRSDLVSSGSELKKGPKVEEPVWDLLEVDSEEELVENHKGLSGKGSEVVEEAFKNVTVRRPKSESPEYLLSKSNDEDTPPCLASNACTEAVPGGSKSFLCESVEVPSPMISRGPRRGKVTAVQEKKGDFLIKPDRVQSSGSKVNTHDIEDEESEEVQEIQPSPPRNKEDDLPEAIPCPICNREFPLSEIEVHASECNQEEEDPLPRSMRGGRRNRPREDVDEAAAGAVHQQFDVEMTECEEEVGDDDEFDAACSSQEHAPRPAPLSTFVPISQLKDSLIDYSNQFPHTSSNVNVQSALDKMRQSLLSRVRKKTRWRKKRKPKWKGKKF